MTWKIKPIPINQLPLGTTHILYIDETGTDTLPIYGNTLVRQQSKFCLTGVIVPIGSHQLLTSQITNLKRIFWPPDGKITNKRVCFHSHHIFHNEPPFSSQYINFNDFMNGLFLTVDSLNISLVFMQMDKNDYVNRYGPTARPAYEILTEYLLERFIYEIQATPSPKGIVIFEGRDPTKDRKILASIHKLRNSGNHFVRSNFFRIIDGVYFNRKRTTDDQLSYPGLEVADFACKVFFDHFVINRQNSMIRCLENKLRNYPNYLGCGVKSVP